MTDDRAAIAALIYRYAELLDAGDLEGVAELFASGCGTSIDSDGSIGEVS